jgi:two-component system, chemotaxis family, protein-glutamate methylesterase/glutaminase
VTKKIRVLICDDSALMRAMLTEIINTAPDLEVVGSAADPLEARGLIKQLDPDVLTLDVEMPRMSGLDFLERLMRLRPMPVVMISSLTREGSETTLQALEMGAVDFLAKPRMEAGSGLLNYAHDICEKVRGASHARLRRQVVAPAAVGRSAHGLPGLGAATLARRVIAIGASTGGTEAIREVLAGLPAECPPILMVQHMPEMFTGSFARRLDGLCPMRVKEAEDGERVIPGTAYLAPGHSHLSVRRAAAGLVCVLTQSEPVNRHRPAVDVLFQSVAELAGSQALGVLLTGMGKDGAQGLLAMRRAGAWTIAQDEESCVVYGMPREAVAIGAAAESAPLKDMAQRVWMRLQGSDKRGAAAG